MRRSRRLGVVVVIATVVAWGGSGCTVIPVQGPSTVTDAGSGDPLDKPFQRMIAIEPQKTWGPEQTIRGMQAAMAAYADDPTILPRYLTPEARAKWSASGPVTVIEDGFGVAYPTEPDADETTEQIEIKTRQVARIDEDDAYIPSTGPWERSFELTKAQGGGYRVSYLPEGLGLVLTRADVARAYRATNLYYLNRTQDRLVADRVRLRIRPTESFARTILERLLQEPSSALKGAVLTSFAAGTKVESVRSGEERVVINLSGPLGPLDPGGKDALMAQIRWSLNENGIAKGRGIEVQVDGELYRSDRPNSHQRWLDDSGDSAYYVNRGALHYMRDDGPGGAVPGAAGKQRADHSHFALAKQSAAMVAAKTSTGISVASLSQDGQWQEVIQGAELTPPSWHRDGSLWTYDIQNGVALRYDPVGGRGAERISAPYLKGLDVTRLRIARDGVRVVVTTGKNTVQIGALTGAAAGVMLGNFQPLTTTEGGNEIEDVAWGDDEHLFVLAKSKAGQILNEINVGDGETVEVPLKDRLESVAALNDRVLAEADMDGGKPKILELNQDRQTWSPKIDSEANTPLFPLG
ncbi:GerMN domain-containing protein [Nonomuraea sp. K274]|uniref:GerMN domain-containing protein n=1 Tax=Nonomuraea cypriaca TaxID=1187855 RepID=A0A931AHQ0_9ACTN|nr:LpqB family beta-propeller domain-containing protein [Nonomuraea cypriaca]MBF8189347.1 GerMN domain-containing protein [Nonomuraea cypriaca]